MSDANQGIAGRTTEQLLDTDDDGYVDSCAKDGPVRFVTGPGPDYPVPSVDSDTDPDSTPDGAAAATLLL